MLALCMYACGGGRRSSRKVGSAGGVGTGTVDLGFRNSARIGTAIAEDVTVGLPVSRRSTASAKPGRCSAGGNVTGWLRSSCFRDLANVVEMTLLTPPFAALQICLLMLPWKSLMMRLYSHEKSDPDVVMLSFKLQSVLFAFTVALPPEEPIDRIVDRWLEPPAFALNDPLPCGRGGIECNL